MGDQSVGEGCLIRVRSDGLFNCYQYDSVFGRSVKSTAIGIDVDDEDATWVGFDPYQSLYGGVDRVLDRTVAKNFGVHAKPLNIFGDDQGQGEFATGELSYGFDGSGQFVFRLHGQRLAVVYQSGGLSWVAHGGKLARGYERYALPKDYQATGKDVIDGGDGSIWVATENGVTDLRARNL